ncbi:ComEA family DNA-binding protein [Actinoplanes couchii]|uniref:Uncharacterized protein n=1 Tax=Actinoplanes couchii TaxID=403638 RepID=A0ABQ3XHX2_9ACTN|nr:helix-hairpin-helix domain-containing protein [Actinoplanes couchii]MDR6317728.1 hypothetical protein [Actinoplanes couchii]GID58112.1 hypothetical protein Aco03nite_065160 [Actinoplanes couchii]
MTWIPPEPERRPRLGPVSIWWRLGHSAWVLLPIFSLGCLSAAGFCYVGIRARRPMWWIFGLVYTVVGNVCFFLGPEQPKDSVWSGLLAFGVLIVWIASVVHALIINVDWLRWRAAQQPWYLQQQPMPWPAPAGPPAPLPPQVQGLVPPPDQFYAPYSQAPAPPAPAPFPPQPYTGSTGPAFPPPPAYPGAPSPVPAAPEPPVPPDPMPAFGEQPATPPPIGQPATPPPAGRSATPSPVDRSGPSGLVDVNRADAAQFSALPGIGPDVAARAVSARLARGGFHSIAEFAAAVNLAPHEFVAIRERLSCSPPPPPPHLQNQPFGRIVDV